ncbi:hypothetical protein [uncultured Megasphaera sp.]|uniref:hypothetical protein n=1 Tax=uncultured Megasphaera sp. TaxID=165188 RepID=UPI002595F89C|nr:hypothetical protein [uncultured Megasphaera sp.]
MELFKLLNDDTQTIDDNFDTYNLLKIHPWEIVRPFILSDWKGMRFFPPMMGTINMLRLRNGPVGAFAELRIVHEPWYQIALRVPDNYLIRSTKSSFDVIHQFGIVPTGKLQPSIPNRILPYTALILEPQDKHDITAEEVEKLRKEIEIYVFSTPALARSTQKGNFAMQKASQIKSYAINLEWPHALVGYISGKVNLCQIVPFSRRYTGLGRPAMLQYYPGRRRVYRGIQINKIYDSNYMHHPYSSYNRGRDDISSYARQLLDPKGGGDWEYSDATPNDYIRPMDPDEHSLPPKNDTAYGSEVFAMQDEKYIVQLKGWNEGSLPYEKSVDIAEEVKKHLDKFTPTLDEVDDRYILEDYHRIVTEHLPETIYDSRRYPLRVLGMLRADISTEEVPSIKDNQIDFASNTQGRKIAVIISKLMCVEDYLHFGDGNGNHRAWKFEQSVIFKDGIPGIYSTAHATGLISPNGAITGETGTRVLLVDVTNMPATIVPLHKNAENFAESEVWRAEVCATTKKFYAEGGLQGAAYL